MKNQINIEGRFFKKTMGEITKREKDEFVVDLMSFAFSQGYTFTGMAVLISNDLKSTHIDGEKKD